MSNTEETELFSKPLLLGGVDALGSHELCTSLSVVAVRPQEFPSWLHSSRSWGLVCVYSYCWAALRHLISAQTLHSALWFLFLGCGMSMQ